jgi:hypothetical protein
VHRARRTQYQYLARFGVLRRAKTGVPLFFVHASFQTPAAWPPMNWLTCVPARQCQHLHVPYQIWYHFLKNTKKYRRGDTRQNPPEIPGGNTPPRRAPAVQVYIQGIRLYEHTTTLRTKLAATKLAAGLRAYCDTTQAAPCSDLHSPREHHPPSRKSALARRSFFVPLPRAAVQPLAPSSRFPQGWRSGSSPLWPAPLPSLPPQRKARVAIGGRVIQTPLSI